MLAFIFPGQGAQSVGMGKELYDQYESVRNVFKMASSALGYDVEKMIFEGDADTLKITENTQPAILTVSVACLKVLKEKGIKPDYVAGLSLGEYTALVAAGALSFEDAVQLVRKRGKYMQEEVPLGVGGMAAVIGLGREDLVSCLREVEGIVEPANFNCPGQIVISGEMPALKKACGLLKQKGAKRALMLEVSAPFHSSMLKGAGEKLSDELKNIDVNNLDIPVVSNVTSDCIKDKTDVKNILVKQVSNPVLWEDSVRLMISKGVTTFIEVGPGKVLSGFVKKIDKDVKVLNVEDIKSLDNVMSEVI